MDFKGAVDAFYYFKASMETYFDIKALITLVRANGRKSASCGTALLATRAKQSEVLMKQLSKILFSTLFALALSVGAVTNTSAALRVGAARVDITPWPDPSNP